MARKPPSPPPRSPRKSPSTSATVDQRLARSRVALSESNISQSPSLAKRIEGAGSISYPYGADSLSTSPSPPPQATGLDAPGVRAAPPRLVNVVGEGAGDGNGNGTDGTGSEDQEARHLSNLLNGEAGVPGTYIGYGFIRDLGEYNPEMYGWSAMRVYEKMRRSDADVWSLLQAIKLPIKAVEPIFYPAEQSGAGRGNLAKEVCDKVRDNIMDGLEFQARGGSHVTQTWEDVLANALLCIDFGCSASEDLFIEDVGHGKDGLDIRLRGIASRLPLTFYRFWTDIDGETLLGLEQLGYRRERYVHTTIPATNLTINTVNKEGANFYGISPLRAAYSHWYMKSAFYRLDAMGLERNSMGIPWIKGAPGAKKQDASFAETWVQQMAAGERTGLYTPDGYEFNLVGLRGRLRDPQNSIKHHSEMIVRSGLAMFIALGTTQTGSHALANVQLDFFRRSLENYGRLICANYNNTTLRRLVDANFASRDGHRLPYPKMSLPTINVIDPIEVATTVRDLAQAQVGVLNSTDELEEDMLRMFGLRKGVPRTRIAPVMTQIRVMASPAGEEPIRELQKAPPGAQGEVEPEQKGQEQGAGAKGGQPKPQGNLVGGRPSPQRKPEGVYPAASEGEPDITAVTKDPALAVHDILGKLTAGRESKAYRREHPNQDGDEPTTKE